MRLITRTLALFLMLLLMPNISNAANIKHLVVFGDSFSDDGFGNNAGFTRYSNGSVWPEYLNQSLCATCVENYAWGGARSDYKNYNNLEWSGLLWQIEKYKRSTPPDDTLVFILAGINDLTDGNQDGKEPVQNIAKAIQKLTNAGIKNIVVLSLPDITLAPAYNNPKSPDYAKYSPIKTKVKAEIDTYNQELNNLIKNQNQQYAKKHLPIKLTLIDLSTLLNNLVAAKQYQNYQEAWQGTYAYPDPKGYMWWDDWHLMTSAHQHVAEHVRHELKKTEFTLINNTTLAKASCINVTCDLGSTTKNRKLS